MKRFFLSLFVVSVLSTRLFAIDDNTFYKAGDRTGFYVSLSSGELIFTGDDRKLFKNAWLVGMKLGYDILNYLGVEAVFKFSTHNTSLEGSSTSTKRIPYSFDAFQGALQLKGSYPITRRFYIEGGAGGGFFYSDPNFKTNSGDAGRGMMYGEFGCEYFLRSRGLSIGVDPSVGFVQDMKSAIIQLSGFIRYTF